MQGLQQSYTQTLTLSPTRWAICLKPCKAIACEKDAYLLTLVRYI